MIPFNKPCFVGSEPRYVMDAVHSGAISGDAQYSQKVHAWFEKKLGCARALLTPSCTHSLEMAALLLNIGKGDEVILPSYTFVSTANAFALRGAALKFVDIRPDTMNIDEAKIEQAITPATKAIVPVHYAGVACEMDAILKIASEHEVSVVEDAAQAMMSTYKGRNLGTLGQIGAYSFHETKNFTSAGEGGLTIINEHTMAEKAEIVREKGTNRRAFFRGEVDKYSWVDIGSSYLMNDVSAAYLYAQLQVAEEIIDNRRASFHYYSKALELLEKKGVLELSHLPGSSESNAHMFYIKTANLAERTALIRHLKKQDILAVFHYVPLHSTKIGASIGQFVGDDNYTTAESDKLVRLPLYYGISRAEIDEIVEAIYGFYKS